MKLLTFFSFLFSLQFSLSTMANDWNIIMMDYYTNIPLVDRVIQIRTGHLEANPNVPFKGDVLYLEGLGDSMFNHAPLFNKLTDAGYRVIAFDYMGQGGSEGTMNHTRIKASLYEDLDIQAIAENVRKIHQRGEDKVIILGWSTGGLAGYRLAFGGNIKAAILIAPGICPKVNVGEGFMRGNKISLQTLTSASEDYRMGLSNPHVDPIKPTSPLLVPSFSSNLIYAAKQSQKWEIPKMIPGLVFTGGDDSYVKPKCIQKTLKENAPHFEVVHYENARHEIDNEKAEISNDMHSRVLKFLQKI